MRRVRGEQSLPDRPARCVTDRGDAHAHPAALPFRDGAFTDVDCRDLLEFVRDDAGTARELVRVLAPGGHLTLRVPAAGPLAALDALNLHRYLVDTSRRGPRPWETDELGWRRHFHLDDLMALLGPEHVRIVRVQRRRLGIGELTDIAGRVRYRWWRPSPERYRAWSRRVCRVAALEDRLVTPVGIVLVIELVRLPEPG